MFPPTITKLEATATSPHLEYQVQLNDTGNVKVQVYLSVTIDYSGGKGLHYAIAFDNEKPQIINSTSRKKGETLVNDNSDKVMMDNGRMDVSIHRINCKGSHVLKFWIIDKGLILQKIVIDGGDLKPSELGPPESYNSSRQ